MNAGRMIVSNKKGPPRPKQKRTKNPNPNRIQFQLPVTYVFGQRFYLPTRGLCECITFLTILADLVVTYRGQVNPVRERISVCSIFRDVKTHHIYVVCSAISDDSAIGLFHLKLAN